MVSDAEAPEKLISLALATVTDESRLLALGTNASLRTAVN